MLKAIFVYPIKSLGGISLNDAILGARGVELDRRWILTDLEGNMLTQRAVPAMAQLKTSLQQSGISIHNSAQEDSDQFLLPYNHHTTEELTIQVWDTAGKALAVSAEADAWFTKQLGLPCRLWYMPEHSDRKLQSSYTEYEGPMSFADGWPLLVVSEASLAALNDRLDHPLPMDRFRPNLVVTGDFAFQEDTWKKIQIGNTIIEGGKPCGRCAITTIDQQTAERGKEPLRALASWRKTESGSVVFGWNMFSRDGGSLKVGDPVLQM